MGGLEQQGNVAEESGGEDDGGGDSEDAGEQGDLGSFADSDAVQRYGEHGHDDGDACKDDEEADVDIDSDGFKVGVSDKECQ